MQLEQIKHVKYVISIPFILVFTCLEFLYKTMGLACSSGKPATVYCDKTCVTSTCRTYYHFLMDTAGPVSAHQSNSVPGAGMQQTCFSS